MENEILNEKFYSQEENLSQEVDNILALQIAERLIAKEIINDFWKDVFDNLSEKILFRDSRNFVKNHFCTMLDNFVSFNFIDDNFSAPLLCPSQSLIPEPIEIDSWNSGSLGIISTPVVSSLKRKRLHQLKNFNEEKAPLLLQPVIFNLDETLSSALGAKDNTKNKDDKRSKASFLRENILNKTVPGRALKVNDSQPRARNVELKTIFELPTLT